MEREQILQNIALWQQKIDEASAKWGGCEICAVTKTQSADTINIAHEGGLKTIGENRVQELMDKYDQLNPAFDVHLIGSLQTNKVKYIIDKVDVIQSLDRISLAEEISRRAMARGKQMKCLVQVNIAREVQKGGIEEAEIESFIRSCADLPGIQIAGLMAIMPLTQDIESLRPYFKGMRTWFDRMRENNINNTSMDILSMGMSGDCIVAAQEGATMVRLGRALFGARPQKF
jgi:pyridoxal phosphate enzyme (YggS family)